MIKYWQCIDALEAQEMMLLLKVQDWPNMKPQERSKLYKNLERAANPVRKSASKQLSNKELADILKRR